MVEVHRLAVAGGEADIAHAIDRTLNRQWRATSRFREVEQLAGKTLELGPDTYALDSLATAKQRLGDPWTARDLFLQALGLDRAANNRAGEAATLNNIGLVYAGLGDRGNCSVGPRWSRVCSIECVRGRGPVS